MYIGLHVNYQLFLLDLNKTVVFSTAFQKMRKYQSNENTWYVLFRAFS